MPTINATRPDTVAPAIVAPQCQPEDISVCGCHGHYQLDADHHEWLLSVEDRGFAGVVDLMTYLSVDADCDATAGALRWNDFADFVAMHHWGDQVRMVEFAHDMERFISLRLREVRL